MRPYLEKNHHKNRAGGVAQGVGPEFKSQYHKKTNKRLVDAIWKICWKMRVGRQGSQSGGVVGRIMAPQGCPCSNLHIENDTFQSH
jgi:hypothetical protein